MTDPRVHSIWCNMRTRCNNPNYDKYQWYGGKGISVCPEWDSFNAFQEWALNNGYRDDLTLDRIDVNGNYTPENCRWVDRKEQANNRTSNRMVTYRGKTQSVQLWAEELGFAPSTLYRRLDTMPVKQAFKKPVKDTRPKLITYNGKTQTISAWARELGLKPGTLMQRFYRGHSYEEVLSSI